MANGLAPDEEEVKPAEIDIGNYDMTPAGGTGLMPDGAAAGGEILNAQDIEYDQPGGVASSYGFNSENVFAEGQFLDKFYKEAVQKGVTTGGNANILNTLKSNKNVLGQQPDQAAHLRDYLSTGKKPDELDPRFAVAAYDYAIREESRKQQNKPASVLSTVGKVVGYAALAAAAIYTGGKILGAGKAALGAGTGALALGGRRLAQSTVSAGSALLGGGSTAGGFWSSTFAQTVAGNVVAGVGGALAASDPYEEERKMKQDEYKRTQKNYLLPGFDYRQNKWGPGVEYRDS